MRTRYLAIGAIVLLSCSGSDDRDDDGTTPARDGGVLPRDGGIGDACESWLVRYELMGSQFEIRGVIGGDRTQTIGPGTMLIRYPVDANDERTEGAVSIVEYGMTINFNETGVETDIMSMAGPDDCGLAMGTLATSTITWSSGIAGHQARGTVTCNADEVVCAFAGLPVGEPVERNNDYELPLAPFAFDPTGKSFEAGFVEIPSPDDPGDSFLKLIGTETSSTCVPLPTGC